MAMRCSACGVSTAEEPPRHRGRRRIGEAFFHRELVAGEFGAGDGDTGKAEAFGDGGNGYWCIGGDTDHAVGILAGTLRLEAFGGGGAFRSAP